MGEVAEDFNPRGERCEVEFPVVICSQAVRVANNQHSKLGRLVFKNGVVQLSKIGTLGSKVGTQCGEWRESSHCG